MMFARAIALMAAVAVGLVGVVRGTWAIGGSDSSCYGLMADAFARGALQPTSTLAAEGPWPNAALTLAPGGFIPSPVRADAASPVCTPGFSLMLAPLRVVGGRDGIFWLTPIAGSLLVWLTYLFARRLGGPVVGAASAVMVAAMPVLLFQVVQPMNDVVVAVLWIGVLLAASAPEPRPAIIGVLTGIALLVRPNLAPAAVIVAAWVAWPPWPTRAAVGRVVSFVLAAIPFVGLAAAFNHLLYGHALQTGYGNASDLFSPAYLSTNARNYFVALAQTQLAFPLLAVVAPFVAPTAARGTAWLVLGVAGGVVGLYLFYKPYPEWWYLRFWLPALAPLTCVAAATLLWASRRRWIVAAAAVIVAAVGVAAARDRQALDLWRLESRFRTAGAVVRDRMAENAVFITVWQSGSVKYHAGREAVLWDSLEPGTLDMAIKWLGERGLDPYIMVEQWEEPLFRARFSDHSVLGDLDWPPRFDIERQVKVFKPSDRIIYMQGGNVPTEYVR